MQPDINTILKGGRNKSFFLKNHPTGNTAFAYVFKLTVVKLHHYLILLEIYRSQESFLAYKYTHAHLKLYSKGESFREKN